MGVFEPILGTFNQNIENVRSPTRSAQATGALPFDAQLRCLKDPASCVRAIGESPEVGLFSV